MIDSERISALALAALRSSPCLNVIPRPAGYMAPFEAPEPRRREIAAARKSRPARTSGIGFHWREVIEHGSGRTNRRRI